MITLYDSALSGNCHKVRMMLGSLRLPYQKVDMNWARVTVLMKRSPEKLPELQSTGRAGLAVLEQRLQEHQWLAANHPTIADISCFPYVGMAPQGEVLLDRYPAVRAWVDRIKALPDYVPMPGLD